MSETYYNEALKRGQKEYRALVSAGEQPYLPQLEDLVPPDQLSGGTNLGILELPAELIVGTRTGGRTNAFSRGFMPLLDSQSEFAMKWKALCKAHMEEGIRDPVKVYEYRNRFYVEEGNKRVSVLKFFNAAVISAQVTRILPKRDGSREVELYYEFLDYYKASRLNFPEFSKPGSYAAFQRLLGKHPGGVWSEEERREVSAAYYYFRQAYEANKSSRRLSSTVGDAMLAYIKVFGFQELLGKNGAELKNRIARVWEEITLQQEEPSIDLNLVPKEEKGQGLLSKLLPKNEPAKLKAAFIHDQTPALSGWTYAHEFGRQHVQQVFRDELETTAYFNAMDKNPAEVIEQAIADGNTILFTTSPLLLPASLRAAVDHPEAVILNCSLNQSHRYIRTYYARMYEAKFITGAIAGTVSASGRIGYVCDYPIFGQIAGINAFAFGVQMTNPRARVVLEWSGTGGSSAAVQRLTDRGITLISALDLPKEGDWERRNFGLFANEPGGSRTLLAMTVWRWGAYYEAILRQIRNKTFQTESKESSRAINYYWGMASGVIDVHCSPRLPVGSRKLAAILKKGISSGICSPFQGPLYDQNKHLIVSGGQTLGPEQIINMDWLAENISGTIPAYEDLNPVGKATVNIVGIGSPESASGGKRQHEDTGRL